ncbi:MULTISPECIES: CAAX prenyl protease-related protein [unclassified Duganella]|uniref:CAAX prenyl protease-related protein n=1 Tax=unclassified Duganella TaxID=2636909 RepID=UPI000E344DB9|nr:MULTISPECIES: CAAX prenyl protease-related protein [unclassified Duganella]RFP09607.1 CAAX prenyl protease-related protein [Duganella sp. BJB475]RFP27727.1 CAAX prenyl protease-related protein [Duganella sp. BJB476]
MPNQDALARILPFAAYISFVLIADVLQRLGVTADTLRWLYPVKIAVVLALLLWYRRRYVELAWRPLGGALLALTLAVGVVVLVLWVNLDAAWMQVGNSTGYDPRTGGALNWWLVAVRIAGAALVVPVMEELFWRSYLMRWLASPAFLAVPPSAVRAFPLVASACLFGVEHSLWLAGIVAGLAYGGLYVRSGRLWAPVLAHAVTNALLGAWIIVTGSWSYW